MRCCCLDLDDVCVGCNRTLTEICNWNNLSNTEKLDVLEKCKIREASKFKRT
ncbi:DUF1289 domain-containing protein [Saccharophagus degradans]|uniref:DUF1289 domain-containing protein n=1 Tax=Saccharophagus degradans TaxID=86304 RepID=A0AAW7X4K3_9GAMM|nr:DUF1289 domain-containing protein [Saccharophagus degradans]MDO6421576.1 DUF1289 domain-containing protein [Saccharophagus degradans]MDO6608538.1 DUF1289 domain-containing protein [Saccharophagus degradans]